MLKYMDIGVRLILIDGEGLEEEEFRAHIRKYPALELLYEQGLYVFDALNPALSIPVNSEDLFMATLYYTAFTCHNTLRKYPGLKNRNFVYFIQDFEPIFYAHNTGYVTALETYRYPHFGIYSTPFLQRWFREEKYGQYLFMATQNPEPAYSFGAEPAIKPWGIPSQSALENPNRVRKVIVYARMHADRNAYELTINALSQAVCHPVFATNWEIIGMGAPKDYFEYLGMPCGKKIVMKIRKNVPENEYRRLVQTGDVGLSLMISPHPSLPPFDLVAAGLVTVTNSFGTKTAPLLEAVSKNFVVVEPYLMGVVQGLVTAARRSQDVPQRLQNSANMNWESSWLGDRCYGPPLMNMVKHWFSVHEPLWPYEEVEED
uniref:Glycosyl transferase family 1 domain-containing protein n=1 Tax=Eutreptiella gymnastica TaxID=73025 RepID=A0A7S4CV53_9EUGL